MLNPCNCLFLIAKYIVLYKKYILSYVHLYIYTFIFTSTLSNCLSNDPLMISITILFDFLYCFIHFYYSNFNVICLLSFLLYCIGLYFDLMSLNNF